MKHIKLGLYILFISFIAGCMNVTRLSSAEMMNTRFPAEHFFAGERAEMGQAIYDNNLAKVKSLIAQGYNVNAQPEGNQSFTYLMYSVFLRNRFEIMQTLLGAGADPNQLSIVYFPPYQSKYIVQPNIKGTRYYLPLSLAAGNSDIRDMEALLKHGANPNADKSNSGGGEQVLLYLLQHRLFILQGGGITLVVLKILNSVLSYYYNMVPILINLINSVKML